MKALLLSALLALSPLAAVAGMTSGEIHISLTILPSCQVNAAHSGTSVICANRSMSPPHISETVLASAPGIKVDSTLVTVEW